MKINKLLKLLPIVAITLPFIGCKGEATKSKESDKPLNVLLIVADDLGWADLGYSGSTFYETPNIDKLAHSGTIFSDGYAACGVCSPSRSSILTGRYTPKTGITDWIKGYQADKTPEQLADYKLLGPQNKYNLSLSETTIAEALKAKGYNTAIVGKWHLGEDSTHYPQYQGFDSNIAAWLKGSPNGDKGRGYYSPYHNPYLTDGAPNEFLTDRLTSEGINWMENNKDDEKPFFLYLAYYVVHTPINPKVEKIPRYEEKARQMGIDTISPYNEDKDLYKHISSTRWHWKERMIQNDPKFAALVESMDENVGRIMTYLDSTGLDDNTMVIFTADNGGLSTAEGSPTSNAPLKAGKGWLYEGGIREAFVIDMPGSEMAGKLCDEPVHGIDIYPTILDACGIEVPNKNEIDGMSLMPLLAGKEKLNREALYWHYPHYGGKGDSPAGAMRKGDYKLIEFFEDNTFELYNLKNDISEQHDLSKEEPEVLESMKKDLAQWREEVGAKMPTKNPYYKKK